MPNYYLNSFDSTPLFVRSWDDVAAPKGLVLVCHDVGEHSGRFEDMAKAFNTAGYVVVAYDQRAFGTTARPERLGFGTKTTFAYSVEDVIFLFRYFRRQFELPLFLLGQGYGAYVIVGALERNVIAPAGVLLLSVAKLNPQALRAVAAVAKTMPKDTPATIGLSLMSHLGRMAGDTALSDPLVGVVPTVQFDLALVEGLLSLGREQAFASLDRTTPLALFEGMKDEALGKEGEGAVSLLLYLREQGFAPRFFGYEDAGHDLLTHALSPRYFAHMTSFLDRVVAA